AIATKSSPSSTARSPNRPNSAIAFPLSRQPDQAARADHTLPLAGALDDVHRLHVAVELLDQVVAARARRSEQLHAERGGLLGDARRERLRPRRLGDVGALAIREPSRAQADEARHAPLARHRLQPIAHAFAVQELVTTPAW